MGAPDDERPERSGAGGGPATWIVLTITGLVAVIVAGAIVGYRVWRDRDDEAPAAAPPPSAAAPTTAAARPPTRLFTRRTDAGIELRVDGSGADLMDENFGVPTAEDAPAFCRVVDQATVVAITADEVLQAWMPLTQEPAPEPSPVLMTGMGMAADGGTLGLVLQVGDDVVDARLAVAGARDEMAPVGGLVALAVELPAPAAVGDEGAPTGPTDEPTGPPEFFVDGVPGVRDATLSIGYADGRVQHLREDDLLRGPMVWRGDGQCFGEIGPPIATVDPANDPFAVRLPPPGEQPPDPAAARAAIEATMDALYGDVDPAAVLPLVDDPFAMRETFEAMDEVATGFADAAVVVEEVVFLSPVEAAFEYTLTVPDRVELDELFGRARLVDGAWRVGRGTICRDLRESFVTTCPP